MAKCIECGNSFGFFELTEKRCKSCYDKVFPKCDTCFQEFSSSEMVGGSCESCHEKQEKKVKDQYRQSSVESLQGASVKTVFVASEKSAAPGIFSDRLGGNVNGELLASSIERACNQLMSEGYKIVEITPINSGLVVHDPNVGYGYGGYTSGVVITASTV